MPKLRTYYSARSVSDGSPTVVFNKERTCKQLNIKLATEVIKLLHSNIWVLVDVISFVFITRDTAFAPGKRAARQGGIAASVVDFDRALAVSYLGF